MHLSFVRLRMIVAYVNSFYDIVKCLLAFFVSLCFIILQEKLLSFNLIFSCKVIVVEFFSEIGSRLAELSQKLKVQAIIVVKAAHVVEDLLLLLLIIVSHEELFESLTGLVVKLGCVHRFLVSYLMI